MPFIYILFNFIIFSLGKKTYGILINPITVYSVIWSIAVTAHESGMIYFYDLTGFTWALIFITELIYTFGCIFGSAIKKKYVVVQRPDEQRFQKILEKYILISCIVASISILTNVYNTINYYGMGLLKQINGIYANRVDNDFSVGGIPYLGSFIYIAISLLGIYVKKYGFTILIIPAFMLVIMTALTSGGRANIVFSLLIFFFAFTIENSNKRKRKLNLKQKMGLATGALILLYFLIRISSIRAKGAQLTYAMPLYYQLFGDNSVIYKGLVYFIAPIGALNQYLKTCELNFGQNTFLPIFNILNRLGLIERIDQYQEGFYTPVGCNVGTWIRELVEDFTVTGAFIAIFLFAVLVSWFYTKSKKTGNVKYQIVYSVLMMIIGLSFFDWKFRSSGTWIAAFFGYLIGNQIEKENRTIIVSKG